MNNWRDAILDEFVPRVSKLTLVADPDCLLSEERLSSELRGRGFDLIEFSDSVEFRYAYESRYRSIWDRGEHTDLVVILRLRNTELESLPYDLLQVGRKMSFNLGDIFPNLSYSVIEKLERSLLDDLFDAQLKSSPGRMGDDATKDFILSHVFGIATELISDEVKLLRLLLRLHHGKLQIPPILTERIIQVLKGHDRFKSWALSEIVSDDEAFYAFLQERWPLFLNTEFEKRDSIVHDTDTNSKLRARSFRYPGPDHLPFDHQDIFVYLDNLFLEGKLKPVKILENHSELRESRFSFGIALSGTNTEESRISRLFELVEKDWPATKARYSDWSSFALKWAELSSLVHCCGNAVYQTRLQEFGDELNKIFADWLTGHYFSLINQPSTDLAMLHHLPRCLSRSINSSGNINIALIVVDGLALDQWVTIRQILQDRDASLAMRESAIFAWIPTLTSVSRQSIFSGNLPLYFPSSINSTSKEEKLWKKFWEDLGLSRRDVVYQSGLGDGDAVGVLESIIDPGTTKVVGLVIDKIDKIMHGMQLGSAGMHNQIKQWCQGGVLASMIDQLLEYGYEVWLTADHGNIQCKGIGRPAEGSIAEIRGERVRVYPTPELRGQVAEAYPFAHEWKPVGLPADYFPLVAGGHDAFAKRGELIVGHGGISIEEVIVPLVKFERKTG